MVAEFLHTVTQEYCLALKDLLVLLGRLVTAVGSCRGGEANKAPNVGVIDAT